MAVMYRKIITGSIVRSHVVGIAFLVSGCASDPFANLTALALDDATAASMLAAASDDPIAKACWDHAVTIAKLIQSQQNAKGVFVKIEIARIIQRDNTLPDCRAMLTSFGIRL
jgi:hypothetical protein